MSSHPNGNPPVLIFANHPRSLDTDLRHLGIKNNVHQYPVSDQGRITQHIYRHVRDWRSGCVILDAQSFKGKEPASISWCIAMLSSLRNSMSIPFRILVIRPTKKNPSDSEIDRVSGVNATFWIGADSLETHLSRISELIHNPQIRNLLHTTIWEYEPTSQDAPEQTAFSNLSMESPRATHAETSSSLPKKLVVKGRARLLRRQQRAPKEEQAVSGSIILILPSDDDLGVGYTPAAPFTLRRFSCSTEEQLRTIVSRAANESVVAIKSNAIENFGEPLLGHTGPGAALHRFTQFIQTTGGNHRILILRTADRRNGPNPAITQGDIDAGAHQTYWHSLDEASQKILDAIVSFARTGSVPVKARRVIPVGHVAIESLAQLNQDDEASLEDSPDPDIPEDAVQNNPLDTAHQKEMEVIPEQITRPILPEMASPSPYEALSERLDRLQSDFLSLAIQFFERLKDLQVIGEQFGKCHEEIVSIAQVLSSVRPAPNTPPCSCASLPIAQSDPPEPLTEERASTTRAPYSIISGDNSLILRFFDGKEIRLTGKPACYFRTIAEYQGKSTPNEVISEKNPCQAVQGIRLQLDKLRTGLGRCIISDRGGYHFDARMAHALLS